jgi:xanthine dehydrogenase large subunit
MRDDHCLAQSVVHRSLAHESAEQHVTGTARYVDDWPEPPGCLHLAFGQSRHAHARITSIDLDPVRQAPGVVAVFTAADIPGENNVGPVVHDDPLFAVDLVEYVGQSLFVVAAESTMAARKAARCAIVDYEPFPAAISIADARAADLRIEKTQVMARGDADEALIVAPHRLAGELEMGGQDHFYLEGQVALAIPGEGSSIHLSSSTQHPSEVQHLMANLLGLSSHDIHVEVRRLGGGFGGKETQAALIAGAAVLTAAKTGRPAKCRLDRDDDMVMTGKRHDFVARYDVGFDGDGRIHGIVLELASRCGYSTDLSPAINDRAMFHSDNCYFLENVRIVSHRFKTNTVSNTAFRGFGGPQGMIAIERVMHDIADVLRLDPLDVRRVNLYGPGRDLTPYHMTVEDNIAPEIIETLARTSDYAARRGAIALFNDASKTIKRGIALTPVKFGISFTVSHLNQAGALVLVYADGSILLNHGGIEMGQGLNTKVAQIVADVFGIGIGRVRVTATSTEKVPNTSATAASSGADLNGMAAYNAAMTIRDRLAEVASRWGGCPAGNVVFAEELVHAGDQSIPFATLCRRAHIERVSLSSTGYYATPSLNYDRKSHQGRPFFYFAYGAAVSEVAIDVETGEHRVLRADILHDAGRSLNPALDLGQVEGAYIQGMGWLTMEELVFHPDGRLLSHAPSTYKIPCANDRPPILNIALWRDGYNVRPNIHRSKAVGEPPLMLANSVFMALSDAVAATGPGGHPSFLQAPATPERILRAITQTRALSRA